MQAIMIEISITFCQITPTKQKRPLPATMITPVSLKSQTAYEARWILEWNSRVYLIIEKDSRGQVHHRVRI